MMLLCSIDIFTWHSQLDLISRNRNVLLLSFLLISFARLVVSFVRTPLCRSSVDPGAESRDSRHLPGCPFEALLMFQT